MRCQTTPSHGTFSWLLIESHVLYLEVGNKDFRILMVRTNTQCLAAIVADVWIISATRTSHGKVGGCNWPSSSRKIWHD